MPRRTYPSDPDRLDRIAYAVSQALTGQRAEPVEIVDVLAKLVGFTIFANAPDRAGAAAEFDRLVRGYIAELEAYVRQRELLDEPPAGSA